MKKLLCMLFVALLLLCGCTPTYTVPDTCINEIGGSIVGNTIYTDCAANLRRFTTAVPEGMSLCFDPLCSHAKEDFCAELSRVCSVVSDGERLYVKTYGYGMAQINALNFDGSGRKTLCEYSMCDGLVTDISTDGVYVYYVEGLYRDAEDRNGESYGVAMRIPCNGGDPEAFLDIELSAYAEIVADGENYYITDNGQFHVIDRKTKEVQTVILPTPEPDGVVLHKGNVYLLGTSETHDYKINSQFYFTRRALWQWNGTEFETVITDVGQIVWDTDGVWYTKMLPAEEFELIGSKESYDGKGQSLYDFIRTWTGELVYHDLATGEKTVYRTDSKNLKIEPYGIANGYIIAAVNDYSKLSFTFEYVNLKPEENGTVSVHEAIKSEREIAE